MKTKFNRSPASRYKTARYALGTVILLTVMNCILGLLDAEEYYVDSIVLAWNLFSPSFLGILVPLLILAPYVAAYFLSKRKGVWMVVALVLFALDTLYLLWLFFLFWSDYSMPEAIVSCGLSLLIHMVILVILAIGVKNRKEGVMTDEELNRAGTVAGGLAARVEGGSAAPLAPEVECGVIMKGSQKKLAAPSEGMLRFEEKQLVIAGQGMAASMLVGSLLAPMRELARVGYGEIAALSFTNPKKTQVSLFLPDGRVAMLSFTKANRDRFYQQMLHHGLTMPPLD